MTHGTCFSPPSPPLPYPLISAQLPPQPPPLPPLDPPLTLDRLTEFSLNCPSHPLRLTLCCLSSRHHSLLHRLSSSFQDAAKTMLRRHRPIIRHPAAEPSKAAPRPGRCRPSSLGFLPLPSRPPEIEFARQLEQPPLAEDVAPRKLFFLGVQESRWRGQWVACGGARSFIAEPRC